MESPMPLMIKSSSPMKTEISKSKFKSMESSEMVDKAVGSGQASHNEDEVKKGLMSEDGGSHGKSDFYLEQPINDGN